MRTAYKVLAYLVAAEVAVQAMVMVCGIAGLVVHGINGTFVIPLIALLLLIVSFFTKVRGAIKWAAIVFALVVAQGQIGFLGHEFPLAGALHGLNALVLFGMAIYAGRRLRAEAAPAAVEHEQASTAT